MLVLGQKFSDGVKEWVLAPGKNASANVRVFMLMGMRVHVLVLGRCAIVGVNRK